MPKRILHRLGRYELLESLGRGTMAVVYKAYDGTHDRYLAIKTMATELTTPDSHKRFHREAQLAAGLNHPNIIQIYDFGEQDGILYIAMELLEGRDLKTVIREGVDSFSLQTRLDWMIQLCDAFAFAHEQEIIHRDIKPSNIHIRKNGQVVVTDFGIARVPSSDITAKGVILGTPDYISPEQILELHFDHRADIFSLGLLFYELLTGKHPYRSNTLTATIHKILNEKASLPDELTSHLPPGLSTVITKALEKDVNRRYQNCKQLRQDLEKIRHSVS